MRKRFLSIVALLAVFCIALVGCGGGAPQEEKDIAANFYGEWEYVAAEGENAIDEEAVADMKELGLTFKIYLGEDGTWAFTAMDDEILSTGTWEAQSETEATLISAGSNESTATFDPETGRIRYDNGGGTILILERIGDAATAPKPSESDASDSSDSESGGKFGSGSGTTTTPVEPEPVDFNAPYVGDWELVEMTADDPEDAID
ncbi:MAG: hypothetical protein Q4D39_02660, partial [Coriobacteriaceae bacterium]|nr:hypothetical protein [Coriobacteriaceae bacterium]